MLLSRDELVSALFSETDRAQRLKMPLALIAIGLAECPDLKSARSKPRHEATIGSIVERFRGFYAATTPWADGPMANSS